MKIFDLILHFAVHHRRMVLAAFALLVVVGFASLSDLPVDAVPDITNVQVMINAKTGALDPERVERTVTYPIETEMGGLPGLKDIRSLSKYGLSQVVLVFGDGTDLYFVRQQVAQRLQGLGDRLPTGITPELAPISTGLGEVVMYLVEAAPGSALAREPEHERLLKLRTVQDYVVRPELKKIPGVAEVDTNGGFRREIHVNVDLVRMDAQGITFPDLEKRLRSIGESFGGGYIQRAGQQVIVRSNGALPDLDTLADVPVKLTLSGRPIRVRDVATVREDHAQRLGAATAGGEEAVLGTALMYLGANSRLVARGVTDALARLKLPADVRTRVVYTRSVLVDETIKTVARSLAEGAVLVIVILFLLLGHARAAGLVALAIPVSTLGAVIGMRYFGISANLMSLGALDFGLLVDGAVVMIDHVLIKLRDGEDRAAAVLGAAREVAKPTALGLLIIMVVYVPILSLEGVEGKMFHPMAATVLMALATSLAVAVLLMPALAVSVLGAGQAHGDSALARRLDHAYGPVLASALRHPRVMIGLTLTFAIAGALGFGRLGSDFIPQLDEGDLVLGLARDASMGIDESVRQQKTAERLIAEFPEVESVFSRLGTPESATDPMGVNFADTFVILKKGAPGRTKAKLVEALMARLGAALPATEISPTQPIEMRFNEMLEGSRADVSLRIYGPDPERLIKYVDRAREIVRGIDGVAGAEMDSLTALRQSPVLSINLNYAAMSRFGVDLAEVNQTLEVAMKGAELGSYYRDQVRYPVMLHLDEALREEQASIKRIPIALGRGGSIPLAKIAAFEQKSQVTTIARSFGRRYAALSIFLKDRDLGGFVDEARARLDKDLKFEGDFWPEWGGRFNNLARARRRLGVIIPLTLLAIFALLYRNFRSLRLTALVFSSVPVAVTGGILALLARGIPFSISAAVGFIALLGIAILNSVVLVDFIEHLRVGGLGVRAAVERGARARLRPVLMTALVAGLGFLPMAISHGLGAEVQRPLATVVIGGLITSTLLTLAILPTLYVWTEERA